MPPMHYRELAPDPALRPWVAYHWHFRVGPGAGVLEHRIPPDGGVSVAWTARLAQAVAVGPQTEPLVVAVHGGDLYWGVRFWPGAAPALLPLDPAALRDGRLPLAHIDPAWSGEISRGLAGVAEPAEAARILDGLVAQLVPSARPLDPAVMAGVFRIQRSGGREPIARVAAAAGLSPGRFRRRFRATVGLTPKEFARVRRFREAALAAVQAVEAGETVAWVDLAAEHGYADQAHLVHEFRRLIGLAPKEFRERFRAIDHGKIFRRDE